jgi:serine/threonine protein kinase
MNVEFWTRPDVSFWREAPSTLSVAPTSAAASVIDGASATALSTIVPAMFGEIPVVIKRPTEVRSIGQVGSRFAHELRNWMMLSQPDAHPSLLSLCPLLAVRPSDAALVFQKHSLGDLQRYVESKELSASVINRLFHAIVRSVYNIHYIAASSGLTACAHFDLKPSNLLVHFSLSLSLSLYLS